MKKFGQGITLKYLFQFRGNQPAERLRSIRELAWLHGWGDNRRNTRRGKLIGSGLRTFPLTHASNIRLPSISDALYYPGDSLVRACHRELLCHESNDDCQTLLSQRSVITVAHCARNTKWREWPMAAITLLFVEQNCNSILPCFTPFFNDSRKKTESRSWQTLLILIAK